MEGFTVLIILTSIGLSIAALIKAYTNQDAIESLKIQIRSLNQSVQSLEDNIYELYKDKSKVSTAAEEQKPTIAKIIEAEPQVEKSETFVSEPIYEPITDRTRPQLRPITELPQEIIEPVSEHLTASQESKYDSADHVIFNEAVTDNQPTQRQPRTREEWETIIGGNIFNRIGAIAILFGFAFFLKYASVHYKSAITPWLRICMGFIAGGGMFTLGVYFYRKQAKIFAQGLLGAGIAILYLTAYASYNFYHLVPSMAALAMMSAVTVIAVIGAVACDSLVVTILGLIGGFLTPLLLGGDSSGHANGLGLLAYITLLDIGLLAVVVKKDSWAAIEPLALIGTYVTYFIWNGLYSTPAEVAISIVFLTIFWCLFYGLDIYRIIRSINTYQQMRTNIAVINSLCYYIGMYSIFNNNYPKLLGLITLIIGAAYFITVLAIIRKQSDNATFLPRYLVTAISLMVVATSIQYDGFTRISLWALEAAALVWCGLRWHLKSVWYSALGLFVLAFSALLVDKNTFSYNNPSAFKLIINSRFLMFTIFALSTGFAGTLFYRSEDQDQKTIGAVLHYTWCALLFTLFSVEIFDYFAKIMATHQDLAGNQKYIAMSCLTAAIVWMIYSLPLVWYGLQKRVEPILYSGLISFVLGFGLIAIEAFNSAFTNGFHLLFNPRAVAIIAAIILMFIQRAILARRSTEYQWIPKILSAIDFGIASLGFVLLTTETNSYFQNLSINSEKSAFGMTLEDACNMTLAIVWTLYSILLTWDGARRQARSTLIPGIALFAFATLTAAFCGYNCPIRQFIPAFNYRVLAFAVTIIAAFIQKRLLSKLLEVYDWASVATTCISFGAIILGLELISIEVIDYFTQITFNKSSWLSTVNAEFARDLMLTAVWSLYSLIVVWYGTRIRLNAMVVLGMAIQAIAVVVLIFSGYRYNPIPAFTLLLNFRALVFALTAGILLIHRRYLAENFKDYSEINTVVTTLRVISSLLIFELVTAETCDYFGRELASNANSHHILTNLRQLILSVVWVIYSIALMSYGIWRRIPAIRFVALGIFSITIFKVFLSDLSFLDTLYRIFSFIALGLILMTTSYLYQRYGSFIFDKDKKD